MMTFPYLFPLKNMGILHLPWVDYHLLRAEQIIPLCQVQLLPVVTSRATKVKFAWLSAEFGVDSARFVANDHHQIWNQAISGRTCWGCPTKPSLGGWIKSFSSSAKSLLKMGTAQNSRLDPGGPWSSRVINGWTEVWWLQHETNSAAEKMPRDFHNLRDIGNAHVWTRPQQISCNVLQNLLTHQKSRNKSPSERPRHPLRGWVSCEWPRRSFPPMTPEKCGAN